MKKNNIICCPGALEGLGKTWKVFCAGPIQGAPEWQHEMPEIPGVTWISPRRESYEGFDYTEQTSWETFGLRISDLVLFYIPEPVHDVPGRSYAQTTRTEFGEILGRGKKVVCSCYPGFPGEKYFKEKLQEYGQTWCDSYQDCITEIKKYIEEYKTGYFFTSDTHFGSQRTLELSKRPFKDTTEMDMRLVELWNNTVHPGDKVFHLGDFGNTWPADFLNGDIEYITGNYEESGKSASPGGSSPVPHFLLDLGDTDKFILVHEPTKGLALREEYGHWPILFGHIHGRQKIKSWEGLDIGTDANNYAPVSLEDVRFYIEAIKKGYYDQEVYV